jgi:hypothetical protein
VDGQHHIANLKDVVDALKKVRDKGGEYADFVAALNKLATKAQLRTTTSNPVASGPQNAKSRKDVKNAKPAKKAAQPKQTSKSQPKRRKHE